MNIFDHSQISYFFVLALLLGNINCPALGSSERKILELKLQPGARKVFYKLEKNAALNIKISNKTNTEIKKLIVNISINGKIVSTRQLSSLAPLSNMEAKCPVDTLLRPDVYKSKITVSGFQGNRKISDSTAVKLTIVPRRNLHEMPVIMWGDADIPSLKEIGFTHEFAGVVDFGKILKEGKCAKAASDETIAKTRENLDRLMANGMYGGVFFFRWLRMRKTSEARKLIKKFQRVDRNGEPYSGNVSICMRSPEVVEFVTNSGQAAAEAYGDHPGLDFGLLYSEVRDAVKPCFHKWDRDAYKKFSGNHIPTSPQLTKRGIHFSFIEDFPKNHVVPDNYPFLKYMKWFWQKGDGWNNTLTSLNQVLKKNTSNPNFWTFHDPATRTPSVWGSGGDVDVISQWTYCYPDPIKMGLTTDELFAMAKGSRQKVMKMTQIICYRNKLAPKLPEKIQDRASWEIEKPDAKIITIPPDLLREAFWCKIARPVKGIMYHGWPSLVEDPRGHHSYRCTNHEAKKVLTGLIRDIVRPLGPALTQIPDRPAKVAFLESATSQFLASGGSWGWGENWDSDMYLVLLWAQLQPEIIYDETIKRDGLGKYKILVLPNCQVLTESVYKAINDFQDKGGIVIADDRLKPPLIPDIVMKSRKRTGEAGKDKQALQDKAKKLRKLLDPVYERHGDSTNPDVIVRFRKYKNTDYLFAVNDKRTFGKYVGHHGKVMEKGLKTSSTLSVRRKDVTVYDVKNHQKINTLSTPDGIRWKVNFTPAEGKLFMITGKPIKTIKIALPPKTNIGGEYQLKIFVLDSDGNPIDAVVPLEVKIIDSKGQQAEWSGYHGAKDGQLVLPLAIAPNDPIGKWTITVRDLASGTIESENFNIIDAH